MRFSFVTSALIAAALVGCGADDSSASNNNRDRQPVGSTHEDDWTSDGDAGSFDGDDETDHDISFGEIDRGTGFEGAAPYEGGVGGSPSPDEGMPRPMRARSVFLLDTSPEGNQVIELRPEGGGLARVAAYDTGGLGLAPPTPEMIEAMGDVEPMTTHGALHQSGHHLLVANAGSNSITTFRMGEEGQLVRTDVEEIEGRPLSIVSRGDLVFVSTAPTGGMGSIQMLRMDETGDLEAVGRPLRLSERGAYASQLLLAGGGRFLVASEATTGLISVWPIDPEGQIGERMETELAGSATSLTAFGAGYLLVSESGVAEDGGSGLSTYRIDMDGGLTVVTDSLETGEAGAAWLDVSPRQHLVFAAELGGPSISVYGLSPEGEVQIRDRVAGEPGLPIAGLTLDGSGRFLYVLLGGNGGIATYEVMEGGQLESLGINTDLGLAMRGSYEIVSWQGPRPIQGEQPDDNMNDQPTADLFGESPRGRM